MGYYSGWDASDLPVAAIPWDGLTHIATAFMIPSGGGFTSPTDPANPSFDPALAASVIAAAHTAGKKAIASIGGADSATAFEGSMSTGNRAAFVASLAALVTTTGYDGIDGRRADPRPGAAPPRGAPLGGPDDDGREHQQ
jgi:chitinase